MARHYKHHFDILAATCNMLDQLNYTCMMYTCRIIKHDTFGLIFAPLITTCVTGSIYSHMLEHSLLLSVLVSP